MHIHKKSIALFIFFSFLSNTTYQPTNAVETPMADAIIELKWLPYATLLAIGAWLVHNEHSGYTQLPKSDQPNTEKFVLQTIYDAYPELKNRNIQVVSWPNGQFSANHGNGIDYLIVPFDDEQLALAQKAKQEDCIIYDEGEVASLAQQDNATIECIIANNEDCGKAQTPTTLDVWQAILLHEGSHIVHKDSANRKWRRRIVSFIAGSFLGYKISSDAFKTKKDSMSTNVEKTLSYLSTAGFTYIMNLLINNQLNRRQEYRADQDVIRHTNNPALLATISNWHAHIHSFTSGAWLESLLLIPHPFDETRAEYFAQAAERLREQQKQSQLKD